MQKRESSRCGPASTAITYRGERSGSWKQSPCGDARSGSAVDAPAQTWVLLTVGRQGASRWMQGPICLKHTHRAGSDWAEPPIKQPGADVIYCRIRSVHAARGACWEENEHHWAKLNTELLLYSFVYQMTVAWSLHGPSLLMCLSDVLVSAVSIQLRNDADYRIWKQQTRRHTI